MSTSTTTHAAAGAASRRTLLRKRREELQQRSQVLLTDSGRRLLADKADLLRFVVLPELQSALAERDRDRRVDADYHRACDELSALQTLLETAGSTRGRLADGRIGLGDRVTMLLPHGDREQVLIVDAVEAPLDDERISEHSPLARALLGATAGALVSVDAPSGTYSVQVLTVERV